MLGRTEIYNLIGNRTLGGLHGKALFEKVDTLIKEGQQSDLDGIPPTIKINTKLPDKSVVQSVEAVFMQLYPTLSDDQYYLQIGGTSFPIKPKIYGAIKAVLGLGVTPDEELANGCREIFLAIIKNFRTCESEKELLKYLPKNNDYEVELRKIIKKVWEV